MVVTQVIQNTSKLASEAFRIRDTANRELTAILGESAPTYFPVFWQAIHEQKRIGIANDLEFRRRVEALTNEVVGSSDAALTEILANRIQRDLFPYWQGPIVATIASSKSELHYPGRLIRAFQIINKRLNK
jgi:hypothetical protein